MLGLVLEREAPALALVLWLCAATLAHGEAKGGATMALALTSTSFTHQGEIPTRHTCEGADVSPELAWSGVPDGTRSLVLIVDDPDAPDPKAVRRYLAEFLSDRRVVEIPAVAWQPILRGVILRTRPKKSAHTPPSPAPGA